MGAPSNGSKTSHSKIANGSNHTTNVTSQASSKRSSSGADGDYQLVQHEVLFSLSSQYEVSFFINVILFICTTYCVNESMCRSFWLNILLAKQQQMSLNSSLTKDFFCQFNVELKLFAFVKLFIIESLFCGELI